ncbi:patatin-like phospholipase family protein [Lysinibacillus endophyticus]|uniref:Patatin family protein n=1 Tax=Ureibacillus endophyticus TaxID=1978490 RepID=A0A494YYC6_9BACL|nr:patatin family protein [Lysinibacillus endophyticus]MCP1144697.1 patatin family protein [Lysinibacillus endophyticus]RKQ14706.1 patatin family protein [Lysinibacillus endophyticus]
MSSLNPTNCSLILEGGTFRTIYTAGILDAFLDHNLMMPYIVGISAGAINACSYVSRQKERTYRVLADYRNDKRYMGFRNFIKEKSLFGLEFAYDIVPNQLDLFDWDTYKKHEGTVLFGVTNAITGNIEYMNALEMDKKCTMLRATCAIPVLFPEIKMNDTPYFDGGLADPIPIKKAIEDGYKKHVIILTRPHGYRKHLDRQSKWVMRLLRKKYPKLVEQMAVRADKYNQTVEFCEKLEQEGKAMIFRPEFPLNSMEKNVLNLRQGYEMGYKLGNEKLAQLVQFINN